MISHALYSTLEAARFLGLHPDTLRAWRGQRRGPAFSKIGNRYRYSEDSLRAFVEAGKEAE